MIRIIKKFSTFVLIFFYLTSSVLASKGELIGTVGSKPLTNLDVVNEMKMLLIINGGTFSEKNRKEIQSLAIKTITTRLIKKIEIEKYNFNDFNKSDLIREINNIAKNLDVDVNNLQSIFEKNNVNFNLLEDRIVTDLKWNGLIFNIYKNRIGVNLNEINDQLELIQKQNFIEEYLIYEILLERLSQDKLPEKINEIKNEIKINGFEKTASKYSKSESAWKGGKLGWIKETMLSKKFKEILKKTSTGSISEPVLMPEGIMILKLSDKRKVENEVDLEVVKDSLLKDEKQKKLKMYSLSHYNKLKQSILINYNF